MEFEKWPATPRLNRDAVYTEKLDGTNAAVVIEQTEDPTLWEVDGLYYDIGAQSRNRLITTASDNAGFAGWVLTNAPKLIRVLGPGRHFGEWYGAGIQRRYGLTEKRFALFNTARWEENQDDLKSVPGLEMITILDTGLFSTDVANLWADELAYSGSRHVPGFMNPEGVCVFHKASRQVFKVTIKDDESPKSLVVI
jgi:hypothetical protein